MSQENYKKEFLTSELKGFVPLSIADASVHSGDNTDSPHTFVTKDSGERVEFESGMRRDVQTGKPRYDLIDRAYLRRLAELYARGAEKYGAKNWQLAKSQEELERFEASALRHMFQYLDGDRSEDHACAVTFNLAAAEYVRTRLKK